MQSGFVSRSQSPWNISETRSPSELHIFFELNNLNCFDIGTPLSETICFKPRAISLFVIDRQLDTHRQTDRYIMQLELADLIILSVD